MTGRRGSLFGALRLPRRLSRSASASAVLAVAMPVETPTLPRKMGSCGVIALCLQNSATQTFVQGSRMKIRTSGARSHRRRALYRGRAVAQGAGGRRQAAGS